MFIFLAIIFLFYNKMLRFAKYEKSDCRATALARLCHAFQACRSGGIPANDSVSPTEGNGKGLSFSFNKLQVYLPDDTCLLHGTDGRVRPGRVTAILGPSGAGKTILFTALLGKLESSWRTEGSLRINDDTEREKYKSMIGFVPQDDVLHAELTVYGNLFYSSELRLPAHWSAKHREDLRNAVLELMELQDLVNETVGDAASTGLNGGKRKALSIATELVAAPGAIFLDEPTTGLDAATSLSLCQVLKDIAVRANVSVAMVVHQPRVEIFNALDELLILGPQGYTVYQGPQAEAVKYFETVGQVTFLPHQNPADVIMDAVALNGAHLAGKWRECCDREIHAPLTIETDNTISEPEPEQSPAVIVPEAPHFWKQVALFHVRHLEKQLFSIKDLLIELLVVGLCGLVLGQALRNFSLTSRYKGPYKAISPQPFDSILPQLHLYMMMSLGLGASVAGVNVFGRERQNYYRDAQSGCNRLSYFLGTATASFYRIAVGALIFGSLVHHISATPIPFDGFFGVMLLAYFCNYGAACAVSVVASTRDAPLVASTLSILSSVFNGFVPFPTVLCYFFAPFWGSQILHQKHNDYVLSYGESTLAPFGYEEVTVVPPAVSYVVMFLWGLVYFLVTLVLLLRFNMSKQA